MRSVCKLGKEKGICRYCNFFCIWNYGFVLSLHLLGNEQENYIWTLHQNRERCTKPKGVSKKKKNLFKAKTKSC